MFKVSLVLNRLKVLNFGYWGTYIFSNMEANVLITICIVKNKLLSDHTKKLTEKKGKKRKFCQFVSINGKQDQKDEIILAILAPWNNESKRQANSDSLRGNVCQSLLINGKQN